VNRNSLLLVEENTFDDYCLEKLQGIEVNKGFASSYFVNNFLNFEVVLENPYLLITNYPINSLSQLETVLEFIKKGNKPLVIIAEQISKEVLSALILMNIQKKFHLGVICFKSIQFLKNFILEDLAFLTHSEYFPKTNKIEIEKKFFFPRELGQAEKVIIKKEKSTFFISKFSKLTTFRRINELNRELLVAETDHEKELIKLRRARLTGNISKIKIPNTVLSQITNEKQNLENLFCLIQSSLEEGIVPGGGTFFFLLKNEVFNWSYLNLIGDEIFSIQIFLKSILICFKTLCINSNFSIWEILKNLEIQGYPFAYDFKRKKIVNSLTDGLIDSSKCIRYILWNSIINTSNLLTLF
jgi:chaperonin GroEL